MPIPTKSFGQEKEGKNSYEIDIDDLAEGIPYKLDYLMLDACLMGGVEVAYALQDKASKIAFSAAEILSTGFDYETLISTMLKDDAKLEDVCEAYFDLYNSKSGDSRSATIACVDCSKLDDLTDICTELFEKYRDSINKLKYTEVQGFYRWNWIWYFDLEDILVQAGITDEECDRLEAALNECVTYKAATPSFLLGDGGVYINTYCGLSMYLPSIGNMELEEFYKELSWNKATSLIK